jgi:Ribbon-helix-helix protein, copG family.
MKEEYVSFKLDTVLFRQIEIRARQERRSRSEMIRVLLEDALASHLDTSSGQALDLAAALQERAYAAGNEALINKMLGKEASK